MTDEGYKTMIDALNQVSSKTDHLIGKKFEYEYLIDKKFAETIIKADCPDKLKSYELKYTLSNIGDDMYLVAMYPDDTVDFTVKLVKSNRELPVIPMDLQSSIDLTRDTTKEYKRISTEVYLWLLGFVAAAVAVGAWLIR